MSSSLTSQVSLSLILGFLSNKGEARVCLQDFEILKCIGKGGFAKVFQGKGALIISKKKRNWTHICNEGHRESKNHTHQEDTPGIPRTEYHVPTRLSFSRQNLLRFSICKAVDKYQLNYLHLVMDFCPGG